MSLYRRFSFANIVGMLAFVLLSIIPATPARCELTEQQRGHLYAAMLSLADDAEEAEAAYYDYLDAVVEALSLIGPGDHEYPDALAMISEIELCTTLADAVAEATDPEEVYENSALVLTAMQANELPHFTTSEILEEMEGWVDQLALWAADELQEPQNTEEYEEALDNIAALSVQVKAARDSYSSDASEVRRSTQSGGMDFAKQLVMCAILGAGTGLTALGGLVAGKSIGMFAALTLTSAVGWWITGGISLLVCVLCIWWI